MYVSRFKGVSGKGGEISTQQLLAMRRYCIGWFVTRA